MLAPVVQKVDHDAIHLDKFLSIILVKMFATFCVSGEENVIQVEPPPEQCWVFQVKHILHILNFLRTLTLFSGGGGWGQSS